MAVLALSPHKAGLTSAVAPTLLPAQQANVATLPLEPVATAYRKIQMPAATALAKVLWAKTAQLAPLTVLVVAGASASTTSAKIRPRPVVMELVVAAKTAQTAPLTVSVPLDKTAKLACAKPPSKTAAMELAKQTKAKTAQLALLTAVVQMAKPAKTTLALLHKVAETALATTAKPVVLAPTTVSARMVSLVSATLAKPLHRPAETVLATMAKTVELAPTTVSAERASLAKAMSVKRPCLVL